MPADVESLIHLLESLVKEKLRATPPLPPDERARLMEALAFVGKLSGIQRLRDLLIKTQRELEEARSAPLEYGIFLGVCRPAPSAKSSMRTGSPSSWAAITICSGRCSPKSSTMPSSALSCPTSASALSCCATNCTPS